MKPVPATARRGFTLLEFQAALYLGLVISSLAALLLFYEWERQVRVQEESRLQAAVQSADATLQWALLTTHQGELSPQRLSCKGDDEGWSFDQRGIFCGGKNLNQAFVEYSFSNFKIENKTLVCDLEVQLAERRRHVSLRYRVPPWWSP